MEARATAKYVRGSARKTNQVLDLVRGQDVEAAMQLLTFTPKHVARTVLKVLKSAVANAGVLEARLNPEDLYVKECLVGPAPIMKRFLPRAQGRATPILKRSCHITIIVSARKGALDRHVTTVAAPAAATGTEAAAKSAKAAKPAAKKKAAAKPAAKPAAKKAAPKKKQKEKSPLRESKRG